MGTNGMSFAQYLGDGNGKDFSSVLIEVNVTVILQIFKARKLSYSTKADVNTFTNTVDEFKFG